MPFRALAILVLSAIPAAPVQPSTPANTRVECLKSCAGAPKEATGARLLECLNRCDAPTVDAGVLRP